MSCRYSHGIALLLLCSIPAWAEEIDLIRISEVGAGATAVEHVRMGGHQYLIAGGPGKVYIVNVDDPLNPIIKSAVLVLPQPQDIDISGHYAYVAANVGGLLVFDISNPDNLSLVASYKVPGHPALSPDAAALSVHVAGETAYITFFGLGSYKEYGLHVVDVSDPTKPVRRGLLNMPHTSFSGVTVNGKYAYVTIGLVDKDKPIQLGGNERMEITESRLLVVDIMDSSQPKVLSSTKLPGKAGDIALTGSYALVTTSNPGFTVVNVADPAQPTVESSWGPGNTSKILVIGSYAYLAAQENGLYVASLTNMASPQIGEVYRSRWHVVDVAQMDGHVCLAELLALSIFQVSHHGAE